MAMNSEIYLCNNIKLDKNYSNVLSYSENDMVDLCANHAVAHATDYSFIKETKNELIVAYDYGTCLSCNYMAFQNKRYSNKWFFAFIDSVEYVGERQTKIRFTIDAWSTFYDLMHFNQVFVNREHVNSDEFGEHTLPEGLETGEYVLSENNVASTLFATSSGISICVATSKKTNPNAQWGQGQLVNNIFQGLEFAIFSDYPNSQDAIIKNKETAVNLYLDYFAHTTGLSQNDIIDIFMIPTALIGGNYTESDLQYGSGTLAMRIKYLTASKNPVVLEDLLIADNRKLAGDYVPRNKKLLCFPYRYLLASNGTGQDVVYNWEDFIEEHGSGIPNYIRFDSVGDLTPNGSIKCIPQNYKGLTSNYNEAINFSKYPTCSWIYDAYTNWMTQNNVNNAFRTIGGIVKIGVGLATPASATLGELEGEAGTSMASSIGGGINDILGVMMEQYQHQFDPNQAKGNINSGDINFSQTKNEIQFYKMSIKREYAIILDGFFNRFGYTVNTFKTPNITGRTYWNYVKTTAGEKTIWGTIPANYIDEINNAFTKGITIWHNHNNLGNFALDNSL